MVLDASEPPIKRFRRRCFGHATQKLWRKICGGGWK